MNDNLKVAFDCDMTIWDEQNNPRHENVQKLIEYAKLGCKVILWSGNGVEHAERAMRRCGIESYVAGCYSKTQAKELDIDICYDDQEVKLAKVNIRVRS